MVVNVYINDLHMLFQCCIARWKQDGVLIQFI